MKNKVLKLATASGLIFGSLATIILVSSQPKQLLQAQPNTNLCQGSPCANSGLAQLSLPPVHPDEPAESSFNERFSFNDSLDRIGQIRSALTSFQQLTEKSKSTLGEQTISSIGHTDWETQNLGFPNWVNSVEGTMRKQEYEIKKLEFELAKKQYEDGEITKTTLDQKEASYRRIEQEFQTFWNSFTIVD